MEAVKSGVLNEEMRRRSQGVSTSQSEVLAVTTRERDQNRCREFQKDPKRNRGKEKENDSDNETNVIGEFNIVYSDDIINLTTQETTWVIDSGATIHATPRKEFFSSYTPGDFGTVKMGNDNFSMVVGKGDVCLETMNGTKLILRDVRHVPDMRLNLISIDKLDEEGYCNTFYNSQWKLTKGSLVVARGTKQSKLFVTQMKISQQVVNVAEDYSKIQLWHRRLGHMSEKSMTRLVKKNALPGLNQVQLKKCADCLAGKQNRVSFKSFPPSRKQDVLDLVHSDVCGPFKKSLGGARYFVTFIDDHSRKTWVYTLKSKDQVLEVFKQFLTMVERETGKKLKCIRTDNGGEYTGPFDAYCREHGIRHQFTPPKTPQLNGLAERMNRTLIERTRCLLSHSKLPKMFWGEAVVAAAYVLNHSPCVPLQYEAPEKVWSGKDISYDHLRVFGCKAYVHVPKDERSKLDVKTRECVFIGYGQDLLGYRFYDPLQKKLVRSRDVVFVEDQTMKDIDKAEKSDEESVEFELPPAVLPRQDGDDVQDNHPEVPVESEPTDVDGDESDGDDDTSEEL